MEKEKERLKSTRLKPEDEICVKAAELIGQKIVLPQTLEDLLKKPHVHYDILKEYGYDSNVKVICC